MKLRPKKQEGSPGGGPDDIGAMLASNEGFPLLPPQLEPRRKAELLFYIGWRLVDIADALDVPEGTIAAWKSRGRWDQATSLVRCESAVEAQFIALVLKQKKSPGDFKEIDLLGRQMMNFERRRKYQEPGGNEGHLNPNVANRNAGPKKAPKKNLITQAQLVELKAAMLAGAFAHQHDWLDAGDNRTRMLLKSRQIGATHIFSEEALCDAVESGRNQIFLSASKSQAFQFRAYIKKFVMRTIGVELSGDPIIIERGEGPNGEYLEPAELYFLGTNSRTAQSYHGNFYFDEFFWVYQFETLNKVARAMATQKMYRKTYLSTPSSINHEAYPFWTGEAWRKKRRATVKEFDTSWKATRGGILCPDRIWRQTVTVEDAVGRGFDRIDVEELRDEYSVDEFDNLFLCGFVDDTMSVFPQRMLLPCQVDEWDAWPDVQFSHMLLKDGRPFRSGEVWLSYDPNGEGENADKAGLVIVAPPTAAYPKFRVLHRLQLNGSEFSAQAEVIRRLCGQYNVTKIDIDTTGIGTAVLQLVRTFFPGARGHRYDPAVKTRMVLKTLDVIGKGRLEYPAGWHDLSGALMSIRKTLTGSGRHLTYIAGRSKNNGHADLAWALFQCLDNEPLEHGLQSVRRSSVEIYTDD